EHLVEQLSVSIVIGVAGRRESVSPTCGRVWGEETLPFQTGGAEDLGRLAPGTAGNEQRPIVPAAALQTRLRVVGCLAESLPALAVPANLGEVQEHLLDPCRGVHQSSSRIRRTSALSAST